VVSAVGGDSHKNAEVRRGLAPLVDLAVRMDAALLGITHYSKGTGGRDPLERVTGSIAFGALARVVLGTVRMEAEEGQPQKLMLARAKSNIGPDGGGFIYAFEQVDLPEYPGVSASRITWGAAVEGTARELLAEPEMDNRREAPAREEAEEWLRDMIEAGPVRTEEIKVEAKAAGLTWATIRRAKENIGAKAVRHGYGEDGGWFWKLPNPVLVKGAQTSLHPEHMSTFDSGERLCVVARVESTSKDAHEIKDAKGAHLDRVNTLGEHLPDAEVLDL
jgi:putative DNA primase/helicase